ncbi:MAG: carbamoyl phosphate synthase large subunit [Bdellovibrionales bacterium GWB1_55_8]|nr:MAG: carbamoyl phosphate synthase large subunit [Bdellovibrionales bacterium GWB1_55_8]
MPKRTDIRKILLIGSGPIVIGQACEFDYSGTQALKALREEGFKVILANSNPATIMTDPALSDRVYIEPLTPEFLERIIEMEKPDALLPTMGGQTALNLTMALYKRGVLAQHNVEILGANPQSIHRAEDREAFKAAMDTIGVKTARSAVARSREDGLRIARELGLPLVLRPSFTLGGEGGGIVRTLEEFLEKLDRALFLSPSRDVLVEESLLGWKEFELEVVRDRKDNVIIVCSIENVDPMGVHTGDSITVAPAQTLTDREYQELRNQAIRIIRAIGVETGGSNVQFAMHPTDGRIIAIEMNPRVSRSSALASKATGFPIARVAAKLAVGYTLDELTNDITGTTPCSFEPSIDYVVTKIPRFDFEKFRPTEPLLGTQMKSVGEVMAMGLTFEESLGKALAGLETDAPWLAPLEEHKDIPTVTPEYENSRVRWDLIEKAHPKRLWALADGIRNEASTTELSKRSGVDRWFLDRIALMLAEEKTLLANAWPPSREELLRIKKRGWTDRGIARLLKIPEEQIRIDRENLGVRIAFHQVDTCAAEFEAKTPYLYSSYSGQDESKVTAKPKVLILGGGPNRIGQGIEFDYCCVHAAQALQESGIEAIMVNSNPETVSTDFDTSDKLYFEPVTPEHVLAISAVEKPLGAIVQFGGQTPLKIAQAIERGGLRVLGTSTASIDLAENREKCDAVVRELAAIGLEQPPATIARTSPEAVERAEKLGYPVLVRPSYVLGGKGMRVVHNESMLRQWIDEALHVSEDHPVLIDRFLHRATEVDVDAISDGKETFIAGLMEHIEEAGIHSGDSACSLPVATLPVSVCDRIRTYTRELAKRLRVIGLMNVQFAIQGDRVFLLEVNPRASRTVPFVSKAVGKPVAKIAVQVMLGKSLHDLGIREDLDTGLTTFHVKAPVFPFSKFPGVDVLLGPEMKSTGEVMGRAHTFAAAYAKALAAAGMSLPGRGTVFLSIRNEDKAEALSIAKNLKELGFDLCATHGTAEFLNGYDLNVRPINKVRQGSPHCVDSIRSDAFCLIINTTSDDKAVSDSFSIRRAALERKIPYCTVLSAGRAMVEAIREERRGPLEIMPLEGV